VLSLLINIIEGFICVFLNNPPRLLFLTIWFTIEAYFLFVVVFMAKQIEEERENARKALQLEYEVCATKEGKDKEGRLGFAASA
jgi:hypothetical protein